MRYFVTFRGIDKDSRKIIPIDQIMLIKNWTALKDDEIAPYGCKVYLKNETMIRISDSPKEVIVKLELAQKPPSFVNNS